MICNNHKIVGLHTMKLQSNPKGKTTLLRYVLENSTEKIACIVNDVASINIDVRLKYSVDEIWTASMHDLIQPCQLPCMWRPSLYGMIATEPEVIRSTQLQTWLVGWSWFCVCRKFFVVKRLGLKHNFQILMQIRSSFRMAVHVSCCDGIIESSSVKCEVWGYSYISIYWSV